MTHPLLFPGILILLALAFWIVSSIWSWIDGDTRGGDLFISLICFAFILLGCAMVITAWPS